MPVIIGMRDLEVIDSELRLFANPPAPIPFAAISCRNVVASELRLIAAVRRTAAEVGAPAPRIDLIDQLLDEWIESTTIDPLADPLTAN